MTKSQEKEFNRLIEKGERFIAVYCGHITSLHATTPIEAVKYFYRYYNATMDFFTDMDTGLIYVGVQNKKPDIRGHFNYTYKETKSKDILLNVDDLTRPIVKLTPAKNDGSIADGWMDRNGYIYQCGYQAHSRLADEIFLSKTVDAPGPHINTTSKELALEQMGWVKISSHRITFTVNRLSQQQKSCIVKYTIVTGHKQYSLCYDSVSADDIINRLKEY